MKLRKRTPNRQIVRYAATPAIVAAHASDGLASLETAETDLTLSIGASRRREVAAAMLDRALKLATERKEKLGAFVEQCGEVVGG